ncbi:hypothetical protein MAA_01388 [Metarhizium robertsii ARSEF 23]|uniref:Uncharacterized protein n=1 Tax=Metarhizium robertsii (strain ARSEF 23 / ATCC MYA-3075) TaxID=655844 RepID=E9EJY3_METRA|nr:uncharacterized protein MAA_01388 [Metarhizium robertsii ARSEF 23]EFZ04314.1 hypothetical protein MAA_01388 [Metarhizium robertsii ARSEF 23]
MSKKGGRPKTYGVHEHFAAAPIPPGGHKFTQHRVRCKYCSKTMAKHVQRQQNHLAKECLGFHQAAGCSGFCPTRITTALSIMDRNSKDAMLIASLEAPPLCPLWIETLKSNLIELQPSPSSRLASHIPPSKILAWLSSSKCSIQLQAIYHLRSSGMIEFIQILNPAYKPPCGDRIASILPEVYQDY